MSYIPDPPPYTPESGDEEGSRVGNGDNLAEAGDGSSNPNSRDGLDGYAEASTFARAANPAVSLDDLVPERFEVAEKEGKEGKWAERVKKGNKMLVDVGRGFRGLKRGVSGRGRAGGGE